MKNTAILGTLLCSTVILGQIGVQTGNPQGPFHIDAARDNPNTGSPTASQQTNDLIVTSNGNLGVGTTNPSTKLDIFRSTSGAVKIADGTQGNNKILVSDANGIGTWQNTSPAIVIDSNAGSLLPVGTTATYLGANATVTIPGYYAISPRFIGDKSPVGCSPLVAYNLSTSPSTPTNLVYPLDAHFPGGVGAFDFIYSSSIAYLQAGTYYMLVRRGGGCSTYNSRNNIGQNGFTLVLLK